MCWITPWSSSQSVPSTVPHPWHRHRRRLAPTVVVFPSKSSWFHAGSTCGVDLGSASKPNRCSTGFQRYPRKTTLHPAVLQEADMVQQAKLEGVRHGLQGEFEKTGSSFLLQHPAPCGTSRTSETHQLDIQPCWACGTGTVTSPEETETSLLPRCRTIHRTGETLQSNRGEPNKDGSQPRNTHTKFGSFFV